MVHKGQAALDYLTTFGWAIAAIAVFAAVLFSLGIFDAKSFLGNKAVGFSQVAVKGWDISSEGAFRLKLSNQGGYPIRVTSITVQMGNETTTVISGLPAFIGVGQDSGPLNTDDDLALLLSRPGSYTAKVTITYADANTGFVYSSAGTLTGRSG